MSILKSLSEIYKFAPFTHDELKKGLNNDSDFDEELVSDIAEAFNMWRSRQFKLKDPYTVWRFKDNTWEALTGELQKQDAYREWYRLTSGGQVNCNAEFEEYYHLGSLKDKPVGKHSLEEDEDDFSARYLLAKSFGD